MIDSQLWLTVRGEIQPQYGWTKTHFQTQHENMIILEIFIEYQMETQRLYLLHTEQTGDYILTTTTINVHVHCSLHYFITLSL